jgi:hypothetical protein
MRDMTRRNGTAGNGHPQTRMPHRVIAAIIYRRHGVRSRPRHH